MCYYIQKSTVLYHIGNNLFYNKSQDKTHHKIKVFCIFEIFIRILIFHLKVFNYARIYLSHIFIGLHKMFS